MEAGILYGPYIGFMGMGILSLGEGNLWGETLWGCRWVNISRQLQALDPEDDSEKVVSCA